MMAFVAAAPALASASTTTARAQSRESCPAVEAGSNNGADIYCAR